MENTTKTQDITGSGLNANTLKSTIEMEKNQNKIDLEEITNFCLSRKIPKVEESIQQHANDDDDDDCASIREEVPSKILRKRKYETTALRAILSADF